MPRTVLIVDDEPDALEMYKTILTKEGFRALTAGSGQECLRVLEKEKVDLVLLDVFMPKMSGRQVAEEIRKNPKLKDVNVAFLTIAEFSKTGKELIKEYSPIDYIQKPVGLSDFVNKVKAILRA